MHRSASLRRLDLRRHASLASRNARVRPKGVYLIALQLRPFLGGGVNDHAPLGVHVHRHLVAAFRGMAEKLAEHGDDVLEAMVVVVEKDDVIGWLLLDLVV